MNKAILLSLLLGLILISPTFAITIQLQEADTENLEDTYVDGQNSATDYGDSTILSANYHPFNNWAMRAYFKFNISNFTDKTIENAIFCIKTTGTDGGNTYIDIYNSSNLTWVENSVTFDNDITLNDVLDTISFLDVNTWYCGNVTNADYTKENITFGLKHNGSNGGRIYIYSKEYATASLRPYLNITYTVDTTSPAITTQQISTNHYNGTVNLSDINLVTDKKQLNINVSATDANLESVWARLYNAVTDYIMSLVSGSTYEVNMSLSKGSYNISSFANDTTGNQNNTANTSATVADLDLSTYFTLSNYYWDSYSEITANSTINKVKYINDTGTGISDKVNVLGYYIDGTSCEVDDVVQSVGYKLYERYITSDDDSNSFYGTAWKAQTFTIGNTGTDEIHTITSVKLKLYRGGSPETITVSIKATDGVGKPTGSDLCSGTLNGSDFTDSYLSDWYEFDLGAGASLSASTKYAIVVRAVDGSLFNKLYWMDDCTSSSYSGGSIGSSSDSGSSWSLNTGADYMFEEYGGNKLCQYTHTINKNANWTDLEFYDSNYGNGTPVTMTETSFVVADDGGTEVKQKNVTMSYYYPNTTSAGAGTFTNATSMTICMDASVVSGEFLKVLNSTGGWEDITPATTGSFVEKTTAEGTIYYVKKIDACFSDGINDFVVKVKSSG